jgi:sugar transferase (PEP-CTERM/EpsH1 system associated)
VPRAVRARSLRRGRALNVLFLAHRLPYPPNKGDKIRSYHFIRYLAARHDVYVATLIDDAADLAHVDALRRLVRELHIAHIERRSKAITAARALASGRPVSLAWFHTAPLQRAVDALVTRVAFDAILGFSSPMAEYVFRSRRRNALVAAGKALDLIDIDSYKWQQYAERSRAPLRWLYAREARLLASYERRLACEFDALYVVTEQEKKLFPGHAMGKLHAMQNGVDLEVFAPGIRPAHDLGPAALVFTGQMDYWPNVEGVKWFAGRVWPAVRSAVPEARFYIVGSRPTREVRALGDQPGIVVTGYVDDVRDYLAGARACVAPLRIARGIQNKVLEAMASAKAVVASPQAFEGIAGQPGRDALVPHDEQAFAKACVHVLRHAEYAAQLGRAARVCVQQTSSWDKNLSPLDDFLAHASSRRGHNAPDAIDALHPA